MTPKRILLKVEKSGDDFKYQVFTNIKSFCSHHPGVKYDDVTYCITRKKQPYKGEGFILYRITITK